MARFVGNGVKTIAGCDGAGIGTIVGRTVGAGTGTRVGWSVGVGIGTLVGRGVGAGVGRGVGVGVGAAVGPWQCTWTLEASVKRLRRPSLLWLHTCRIVSGVNAAD